MTRPLTIIVVSLLCTPFVSAVTPVSGAGEPVTVDRPWLSEMELDADEALHVSPGQTVVLDLENTGKGVMRRNELRFLVEEEHSYSFCIPDDEPHIQRIKLKLNGGRTILNGRRGARCERIRLEPGSYRLDIFHNSRRMGSSGVTAFLYTPEQLGVSTPVHYYTLPPMDFWVFRGTNGEFVTNNTGTAARLQASATRVSPSEVWRPTAVTSTKYQLANAHAGVAHVCRNSGGLIYTGPSQDTCTQGDLAPIATFRQTNYGLGLFKFQWNMDYLDSTTAIGGPVHQNPEDFLTWGGSASPTFTTEYQGYDCDTACDDDSILPLAAGQIAVYAQCDYQGPAIVFMADVADMSIYQSAAAVGLGIGSNAARSIRVGDDVVARLYPGANKGGTPLTTVSDIPCLDTTALGNDNMESFEIIQESASDYIVSSQGCKNCILTGVDFSNQDFSGYDFSGSVFTGADLSGATLRGVSLAGANLSGPTTLMNGTDFTAADLSCTSFWKADVSRASFDGIALAEDFSCRLDLESATLAFLSFDKEDWRYMDLSGSTMIGVPQILSTAIEPLDLSGSVLTAVKWLAGKQLDSVNLGCFSTEENQATVCPVPDGTQFCSTLQGLVLTQSSLRRACLRDASMEGVFLSYANLDGADLSGAQLQALPGSNVATLEGAFMRGVDLSGADITGVNASNVNFYSASGAPADATNVTAPGANFSGAYLAGTDFSGQQSNLQSTNWSDALLIGTNFDQADLTINTSGGVNSGTNTTFNGAYMFGIKLESTLLDDVDFTNTYWDALGAGGELNILIPRQNLEFAGYWKELDLPECPESLKWVSGNPPPTGVTDANNVCPNGLPGPCDNSWGDPIQEINLAFFQSADPANLPPYPFDPTVTDLSLQCGGVNNPADLCWTITSEPPPSVCVASP